MIKVTKIVLTGGPCSGKTTAKKWIKEHFESIGYTVIFVPETATEIINSGVNVITCNNILEFERIILHMQLYKEEVYDKINFDDNVGKVLMVFDRGAMDCKGFTVPEKDFNILLEELSLTENDLMSYYDGVFHLVTAAKGAEKYYTLDNNEARSETPEQARIEDDNIIKAWVGHSHFRVIHNEGLSFSDKMQELLREISSLLCDPVPKEIERKILTSYPEEEFFNSIDNIQEVSITQFYLDSSPPQRRNST